MKSEPTPWRALIAAAVGLGIAPHQFWRLSLREWRALSASLSRTEALPRDSFEALSAQFPDSQHDLS
jgi:uncharacterized phage protein (TIGR02216 family)